ncbi:MAG: co-chaperone GroES, partial [Rhodospirillales bacterium]|nr:co-chaperone GroES [Rhodospirillales bacterium]
MKIEDLIASPNIAEHLGNDELATLGDRCVREYVIDDNSRNDWKANIDKAMDLAMQVVERKNYPWPNASNVKYPLLTVAAIQFAARAYPAIVPSGNIVNCKVLGNDSGVPETDQMGQPVPGPDGNVKWLLPPGAKRAKAGRISRHMSWQLREEMEEWEGETDTLLHILPIVGCCFKKTYYDSSLGRNVSQLASPKYIVVNYNAKSMELAPRITQEVRLYPHEIRERERAELFLEREYGPPTGEDVDPDDEDAPHWFLEQHRRLDLDDDGYSEPYVVTVHKETRQVVRIVPRFSERDVKMDGRKVVRIEPIQYFTKYSFLPSPDGGFYDVGFGTLLNPINHAVNSSLNQMLDAGHKQNAGGGFIGGGLRIKGGAVKLRLGEYKRLDVAGGTIKENVVDLKFGGPSSVLFNLLGLLIEAGKDISSVKDVMTGDAGPANEAATRTMARIEQGMKVFTAIYKRIYRAMRSEYKKLFRLNALYLEKETYFTLLDDPEKVSPDDYDPSSLDVVPVADPNQVSDLQKMARAEFLMQFIQDPWFEPKEVRLRILEAGNFEDRDELLVKEPPKDPKMLESADKIEVTKRRAEIENALVQAQIAEIKSKIILNIAKAEAEEAGPQLEEYKEDMKLLIEQVRADAKAEQ